MGMLRIYLFGALHVVSDDTPDAIRLTHVTQGLLAYLLLNPSQPQPRDVLAEIFWGNYSQEQARNCLNTALWRLRKVLEQDLPGHHAYLITNSQGDVLFNQLSPHWLDLAEFQAQVGRVLDRPAQAVTGADVEACCQALSLYTGDLLEGCYDEWAIRQRERTRLLYLAALSWLVSYFHEQRAYDKSLHYAHCILEMDPLREEVHREVMRLCLESGQRSQALRQYESCRAVLKAELGISPMDETKQLYYSILESQDPAGLPPIGPGDEALLLPAVLRQFRLAREALDQAQEQFRLAMEQLEGLFQRDK